MKVFLTGATGYIGTVVAQALQKARHQVIGLVRSDEQAKKLAAQGIKGVTGDLLNVTTIEQAAREADGVVHTASTNDANMAQTDTSVVRAILAALQGTGKPFVYTSGVWVMGNTDGHVADEGKALDPTPLVAWRAGLEQEIIAAATGNVRTIVIRPALVYGRDGGLLAMFLKSARDEGAFRFVGDGENHWSFVHVDDLADLYVRALEKAPAGTVLIGVHGPSHRVREIAEAASYAAQAQGRPQAWPVEEARKVLGPFADALVLDQKLSGERAKTLLGWVPHAPSVLDELTQGSYTKKS
ncbi:MAG: SDR family oxidoreductase [Nitrospiraceae bacterium]